MFSGLELLIRLLYIVSMTDSLLRTNGQLQNIVARLHGFAAEMRTRLVEALFARACEDYTEGVIAPCRSDIFTDSSMDQAPIDGGFR
jgi:hypothetical protein